MNIKEIIAYGANKLKQNNIQDSNIKARVLVQYILQQDKNYLIINSKKEVNEQDKRIYEQYIQELIQGKPLQYITHTQEFMGLDFYVDENVLIPQPDTERLVEEAIKCIEDRMAYILENNKIKILDMCTGSGAIAISIAKYFQEKYDNINEVNIRKENNETIQSKNQNIKIEVYGIDISEEALKIAEKNARTKGVNVAFLKSNMFEKIEEYVKEKFDIIVSNPPYIETEVINTLSNEVRQEPHIALDGGQDGLDFYKIIAQHGIKYLKENGSILMEIGYNQKESVTKLFEEEQQYIDIECMKDLSGNDRVICVKKK